MKSYNIFYVNTKTLEDFILKNKIEKEPNVLVQIFSGNTNNVYIQNIINSLKEFLPHVKIIGATTDGEICNDILTTNKVVLSFSIFEKTKIITSHTTGETSSLVAFNLLKSVPQNNDMKLLITFTEGLHTNGEEYLKSIESINPDLVVAGGLAGDNAEFLQTYIFTEKGIFTNGAVGAFLYNPNLEVNSEYIFGWKEIGKNLKITKSDKNRVYTINNIPAKQIYEKYLGKDFLIKAMEFPLIINKNGTKVARAVLSINDDGSLLFAGNLNEGDEVFFSYGNIEQILEMDLKKYQSINHKPVETFYIYSCMARRRLIGNAIQKEILPLSYTAPTAGFFTYGELYHNKKEKKNELLNQTMTVVSLSESNKSIKDIDNFSNIPKEAETKITTIQALLNLIAETQQELNELNKNLKEKVLEKTKEAEYRFYHNTITNIQNEYALDMTLKNSTKERRLIIVDIDSFNFYNEIYGTEEANNLLKSFGNYLLNNLNDHIYDLYHFHADQFAILRNIDFPDENSVAPVIEEIKRLVKKYKYYSITSNDIISIDVTIGIAEGLDHLIQKALIALTHAKKSKKEYVNYSVELDNTSKTRNIIYWKNEIKKAIATDNIIPLFQPIVDRNKNIIKYEVLIVLRQVEEDGHEKLVSPFFFLDVAVKTKLYPELTKIVVEKSLDFMKDYDEQISINLSFEDIANENTKNFLKEKILKHKMMKRVIFEILESSSVNDYDKVIAFIEEFRHYGVEIAIDDFGAGFSNYMHVLEIEPDYLKLDGSLIKNIDNSKTAYEFVKSISKLCKSLGIKTIAEFIHSKKVFDICKSLDIDQFQGFYFYEPLKAEQIRELKASPKMLKRPKTI